MIEEFRAPAVDRLTLRLFNNRVFQESDFETQPVSGAVSLRPDALRRYFRAYEEHVGDPTSASDEGEPGCLRERFRRQVQNLARSVLTARDYEPFASR